MSIQHWPFVIKNLTKRANELNILTFVITSDVVTLPYPALGQDGVQGLSVVFDVEPVADVFALAVDGYRLASEAFEDDDRDQFFGKLVGPVVVGTIGDEDGEAVGICPCAGKMIGGRLGGRIRGMRVVRRGLGKAGGIGLERAVDFVSGNVEETERFLGGKV